MLLCLVLLWCASPDPTIVSKKVITTAALLSDEEPSEGDNTSKQSLSKRGRGIQMIRDDIPVFEMAAQDPYHPVDNPDGYLVLLVAENKLLWRKMAHKLDTDQTPLEEWVFNYGDMGGQVDFRAALIKTMTRWIPDAPLTVDDLQIQAGASSVLDQLSYILTDDSDGLLIPTPAYTAFPGDFAVYGRTVAHWIPTRPEDRYVPTLDAMEAGYQEAVQAGNPPKIFIICQPHNPTGVVYTAAEMEYMMDWALSKGLHVISDEIYALSTFPGVSVTSAATVMHNKDPTNPKYMGDHVHVVAGLSKDWGMSGFRVGTLLSHNSALHYALSLIGAYQSVSEYTQFALTQVFQDDDFVDDYIAENQQLLLETYTALHDALALIDIPVYPAEGTIFAWADFSSYLLPGQSEHELWMELIHDAKVVLTTGESFQGEKPGLFRIVYPWPEGGPLAMQELGHRLVQWKQQRQ